MSKWTASRRSTDAANAALELIDLPRQQVSWSSMGAMPSSIAAEYGKLLVAATEIAERCVGGKIPKPYTDDAGESVIYFTSALGGWREIAPEAVDAVFAKEKP